MSSPPHILVFDSGLGGLTVFSEVVKIRPDAQFIYTADNAAFPYGNLSEQDLIHRVVSVMGRLIDQTEPDLVVVACNTASTLVLPALRAHFTMPFIGTVPAIKPAAALSASRHITVLATPGTVARDYTHDLIEKYANHCHVTLIGSQKLAGYAEAELLGQPVSDDALLTEISPCFVSHDSACTDVIVLACTHYPLLQKRLEALASWPVTWLDPAPAIAKRVTQLMGEAPPSYGAPQPASAIFTGPVDEEALRRPLQMMGLSKICIMPFPLVARPLIDKQSIRA
jgi:glutamate racemase